MPPPISPMGINIFDRYGDNEWLLDSFGGMFRWNPVAGTVIDCTDGKPYDPEELRIFSSTSVSGYSDDLKAADEIIFDYVRGGSGQ